MSFFEILKETLMTAWRQVSHFIEIMRLKLRIIGFSNKRSGLLTKLGEAVYKNIAEGKPAWEDEKVKKLVEETRFAGEEISRAEEAIDRRKTQARSERDEYRGRLGSTKKEEAAPSAAASGTSSFKEPGPGPEREEGASTPGERESGGGSGETGRKES